MLCTDQALGPSFDKSKIEGKRTSRKWHIKGPTSRVCTTMQISRVQEKWRTSTGQLSTKQGPLAARASAGSPNHLYRFNLREDSDVNAINLEYAREFGYGYPPY